MALLLGAGWVVLCFRHCLCDDVLRPLPCSSVCGLHCTGPTNARQSQWENVISCAGSQVFLVRLGGASSTMRAVHVAAGYSVKEGSSISVSFWLRMPWHGGVCSQSRNGLFCVPWARCTSAGSLGGGAGPGLTRSCSPGHITASDLVPGPWALLPRPSPAIRLPPMGWSGWGVRVSPLFEMLSVLFPGNIGSHFFGISRSFCGNV